MIRNAFVFVALAVLVTACAAPSAPAPAPSAAVATFSNTLEPTQSPQPSPSPLPTRTVTPVPSVTPSPALSLTPSFYFTMPTPTRVPTNELACHVESHSIADGTSFKPGERFTVNWKVTNTGSATWYPASVLFVFSGGTKMHLSSPIHLQKAVPPGDFASLSVDMRAPKNSSSYTTTWILRQGDEFFCPMRMTIWVEAPPTPTSP